MPALREIFAEFDIVFDRRRAIERGERRVTGLRNRLTRLRPAVRSATTALSAMATAAGVGAVAGLQRIISTTIESTREIERWSGRLSISSESLRTWIELGREYGASVEDVTDALKELQLKAQDALTGGTAQAEMFQRIGISLNDLRPVVNDMDALMALFTTRLNRVNDVALRNFTTDELMSDAGTRMNRVFALGTEEIQRRRAALSQQIGPTEALTTAVARHALIVRGMTRRWERFKREVTTRLLPIVDRLLSQFAEFEEPLRRVGQEIIRVARNTNLLQGALIGVGAVAVAMAASTIATWGLMAAIFVGIAAAVAGVAVAYDQVTRTIDGSDTALRRFLDSSALLGEGGTTGLVLLLRDAWQWVVEILGEAANGARLLANDFRLVMNELGPISDALRTIIDLMSYIPGFRAAERLIVGTRETVQERRRQEEGKRARRIADRNRRLAQEGEVFDEERGIVTDYGGQPMSVDLGEVEVEPLAPVATGEIDLSAIDVISSGVPIRDDVAQPDIVPGTPAHFFQRAPNRLMEMPQRQEDRQTLLAREVPRIPRSDMARERAPERAQQTTQNVNISIPTTNEISISEATDLPRVQRIVDQGLRRSEQRIASQMESIVSDQAEVGS